MPLRRCAACPPVPDSGVLQRIVHHEPLETWPRHPLRQCGNNRILSRSVARDSSGRRGEALSAHGAAQLAKLGWQPCASWDDSLTRCPRQDAHPLPITTLIHGFSSSDRHGIAIAVCLLSSYNRIRNQRQPYRDFQCPATRASTRASRSHRLDMRLPAGLYREVGGRYSGGTAAGFCPTPFCGSYSVAL